MLRYFCKRENIRKRVSWNRRLRLFFTLCIRVSRKFCLHLFFKLRYYKQNDAKVLQKLTSGFKNHMRNLDNFTQAVESSELKFDGLLLSKKYITSARHYITKIYLTLLSISCVKIHQITYVIFETIYQSYFTTQFLCIFLLKHYILSTKVAHQSANFQTFNCLG